MYVGITKPSRFPVIAINSFLPCSAAESYLSNGGHFPYLRSLRLALEAVKRSRFFITLATRSGVLHGYLRLVHMEYLP